MRDMMAVWPQVYQFRMLALGADDLGRLIYLRAYKLGFWAWLAWLSYDSRDSMGFCVYADRVEFEESGRRRVLAIADIANVQVLWRRSRLWIGCMTVWFCILCLILSNSGNFESTLVSILFMGLFGFLYWRSRCFVVRIIGKKESPISFSVRRGAFSGQPLPDQALKEMVETINRLRHEIKHDEGV